MFVDPRTDPHPPFVRQRPEPTHDSNELADLVRLCRAGRIYEVERWIESGKPIHADNYRVANRRVQSPLKVAIQTNQFALAVLLLCNGFPPESESESLLGLTIKDRKPDFFELLLAWGADPLRVDSDTILTTYDSDLYERFWQFGVHFTRDHALAHALAEHSSNRPGYGWARRHNDDPRVARDLAMALGEAVTEDRERAVALLMWAGANSHMPVPSLLWYRPSDEDDPETHTSPMMWAVMWGKGRFLPMLKPDPSLDDFEELWSHACDTDAIDHLAKIQPPRDWSRVILRNVKRMVADYGDRWSAKQCVEKLSSAHHARLTSLPSDEVPYVRREILRCRDEHNLRWVLRWMSWPENCEPAVFNELTRTPSMRTRVASLHARNSSVPPRPARQT
jgi:hypothetical protein